MLKKSRFLLRQSGGRPAVGVARNASWLLAAQVISSILGVVQSIILARRLGVEDYGLLVLVITYSTFINQLINFRVWETATKYVTQFIANGEKHTAVAMLKTSYLISLATGLASFGIILLTAEPAARHILGRPDGGLLILVFSFSLLISSFDGPSMAVLRIFNRYSWLSFSTMFYSTLLTLAIGSVSAIFAEIEWLVSCYIVAAVVRTLLVNVRSFSDIRSQLGSHWWEVKISLLREYQKPIGAFLISSNANSLLKLLQTNMDVLLLGVWRGPADVGYYKVAKVLAGSVGTVTNPLYEAIYPELSILWGKAHVKEFKALILNASKLAAVCAVAMVGGILFFGPRIIAFFYGDSFLAASGALRFYVVGAGIALASFWGHPALLAMGQPWRSVQIFAISLVGQLIMLSILVPSFGAVGAAVANTGFYALWVSSLLVVIHSCYRQVPERGACRKLPATEKKEAGSEYVC